MTDDDARPRVSIHSNNEHDSTIPSESINGHSSDDIIDEQANSL